MITKQHNPTGFTNLLTSILSGNYDLTIPFWVNLAEQSCTLASEM